MDKNRSIHSLEDIFNDPDSQELLVKSLLLSRKLVMILMLKILKKLLNGLKNMMVKNPRKLMIWHV